LLILVTFLTNCSGVKQLSIFKEEVKRQELNLDRPTPLQLEQIKWIIITSENASEVFKKMEEQGLDPVLFGLTDNDYQLIAKNFAQIRNQLKLQTIYLISIKNTTNQRRKIMIRNFKDIVILLITSGVLLLLGVIIIGDYVVALEENRPVDESVITLMKMSVTGLIGVIGGYIGGSK
jgi:hypothetical protein